MELSFEEMFEESNWKPFKYKDKEVFIGDEIEYGPDCKVKLIIEFEKTNSDWEQGIFLNSKGKFLIKGEQFEPSIYLWQSTAPQKTELIFESKDGILKIWNIWRIDDGPMQYGHNGSAIYSEKIPSGKRYYCNDGYPDDDFDDLIFTVKQQPLE